MWKDALVATVGLAVGCGVGWLAGTRVSSPMTAADHWRVVNEFVAARSDPTKLKSDGKFKYISVPADYDRSLALLVTMGEVHLVEVILPNVPKTRESVRFWMQRAKDYPEIIEMLGMPEWAEYRPAGTQPFFMKCWVREKDIGSVWKLSSEIEAEFAAK